MIGYGATNKRALIVHSHIHVCLSNNTPRFLIFSEGLILRSPIILESDTVNKMTFNHILLFEVYV